MVGTAGLEPATPCSQGKCATRLRYVPTREDLPTYPKIPLFRNSSTMSRIACPR